MNTILHIFSDHSGEDSQRYYRNIMNNFKDITFRVVSHPFIKSKKEIDLYFQSVEAKDWVIVAFFDHDLAHYTVDLAREQSIYYFDGLTPFLHLMEKKLIKEEDDLYELFTPLDDDYFERIQAIEFAVNNDDGRSIGHLEKADLVLLGISRTSKTPLSIYLANHNLKVANIPLLPEVALPFELFDLDPNKIIGLTNETDILQKIRRERNLATGLEEENRYSSKERIKEELDYAHLIYQSLDCLVINVANRSIEETAAMIVRHLHRTK